MSDLELILEEIEALTSAISSAIYMAKKHGDIAQLEHIVEQLSSVIGEIV